MTKKIGIVGSMINTSDYLLFKDLGERYILKRYDSIVTDGDKDCRDNGACVLTYHDNPISTRLTNLKQNVVQKMRDVQVNRF